MCRIKAVNKQKAVSLGLWLRFTAVRYKDVKLVFTERGAKYIMGLFNRKLNLKAILTTVALCLMFFIAFSVAGRGIAYADEADVTTWTASGSCQWGIDPDGCLWVRPTDGVSGTLARFANAANNPWKARSSEIKSIVIKSTVKTPSDTRDLFYGLSSCVSMDLSGLDTSALISFEDAFNYCSALKTIDISCLDTSSATSMYNMFRHCSALTSCNIGSIDTSKVTDFKYMFSQCTSLVTLDLRGLVKPAAKTINSMFYSCTALTTVDVGGWDTSGVTSMDSLFASCPALESIDLSGWNTSKVTNMGSIFSGCSSLTVLDLSGFDTPALTSAINMFAGCERLSSLDISNLNTLSVSSMSSVFSSCNSLVSVNLGENFSFKGRGSGSSPLPSNAISGYTTKWMRQDGTVGPMTASYLANNYDANAELWAGTWVRQEDWGNNARLTFDANGGFYSGSPIFVAAGGATVITPGEDDVSRPGYYIKEWNTEIDGSGTSYAAGESVNVVLTAGMPYTWYAIWDVDDRVTYTVNHYLENTSGGYDLGMTETKKAKPMTQVTPDVMLYTSEGGSLSLNYIKPSLKTITVSDGGGNAINYYYIRQYYVLELYENGENEAYKRILKVYSGVPTQMPYPQYSDGYSEFLGWSTTATRTIYAAGQVVTDLAEAGTWLPLYAQWYTPELNEVSASEGQIIVRAKAGQAIVIPNLPAGSMYEVEEVSLPNGWSINDYANTSGQIVSTETSYAFVDNSYSTSANVPIVAYKKLINGQLADGMFSFSMRGTTGLQMDSGSTKSSPSFVDLTTVANAAEDTNQTTLDINGDEVPNAYYGLGTVDFGTVSIPGPGVYTILIAENIPNSAVEENGVVHDDSFIYDTHIEEIIITATDNGDGTMSTVIEHDDDGPLFINEAYFRNNGILQITEITKNATPVSENQEFEVTVALKDSNGNPLSGEYDFEFGDETGTYASGDVIPMKGGDVIRITGLPVDVIYEIYQSDEDGWELISAVGASGVIQDSNIGISEAILTNVYSASGSLPIEARKVLKGGTIGRNEYGFELRDPSNLLLETVYADANGAINFSPLYFTEANHGGSYTYYVSEITEENELVEYDTSVKTIIVDVADNGNGTLTITPTYPVEDASTGNREAVFTNIKKASMHVSVDVRGNLADLFDKFPITVTLTNEDGSPYTGDVEMPSSLKDWDNPSDGVYTFELGRNDDFEILLPHGTRFEVTEDPGDYYCADTEESGAIDATVGDSYVEFVNLMISVVPTGIDDYMTIGIWIAVVTMLAAGTMIVIKRKKRVE